MLNYKLKYNHRPYYGHNTLRLMTDNPDIIRAREILFKTDANLFLTGKAGTGKTTFLKKIRDEYPGNMVVVAPTGIAAINAGGSTIHSFFQLSFAPFIPGMKNGNEHFRFSKNKIKLIRCIDLIVIDEISMVRADLLDNIDSILRRICRSNRPFAGKQLLMIGDLQQLAPVTDETEWGLISKYYETPYFFSSHALQETKYVCVELKRIYRQNDSTFIHILNRIRCGNVDQETLNTLNSRFRPDAETSCGEGFIHLVTHNRKASEINSAKLTQINSHAYTYTAEVKGKFPESSFPTNERLQLKLGAQIMFIKNDHETPRRYFNGMLGEIVEINEKGFSVRPFNSDNESIRVEPDVWENSRYSLNEKNQELEEIVEGTFRQYPVRTAWAVTIHKSQGLTFEKAIIDARDAFAHGQTYVALSRLRTLDGLVLSSPIPSTAIITDRAVTEFGKEISNREPDDSTLLRLESESYLRTLRELFGFNEIIRYAAALGRILDEFLYRPYPKTCKMWQGSRLLFEEKTISVAERFARQLDILVKESGNYAQDEYIAERIRKGCGYFCSQVSFLLHDASTLDLPIENKATEKRFKEAHNSLLEMLKIKSKLLSYVLENGFHLQGYSRQKSQIILGFSEKKGHNGSLPEKEERVKEPHTSDILHPEYVKALTSWRYSKAKELGRPAYCILHQRTLICIANSAPKNLPELLCIPGVGEKTIENYGTEILSVLKQVDN